jgi:tetratricopeptide (TPR) repeat protein
MAVNDKYVLTNYLETNVNSYLFPLLAWYHFEDQDLAKAVACCETAIRTHPDSAQAHYIMALAAEKTGNVEIAIEHLKSVIDIDNGYLQAFYKLIEWGHTRLSSELLKYCIEKIAVLNPLDKKNLERLKSVPATIGEYHPKTAQIGQTPVVVHGKPSVTAESGLSNLFKRAEEQMASQFDIDQPEEIEEANVHMGPIVEEPEPVNIQPEITRPPASGPILTEGTKLSEMFEKFRQKPIDELQKETWTMPEVNNEPVQEPAEEVAESFNMEISGQSEPEEPESLDFNPEPMAEPEPEIEPEPMTEPEPEISPLKNMKLADMFEKFKQKPLEEIQQETWTIPIVEKEPETVVPEPVIAEAEIFNSPAPTVPEPPVVSEEEPVVEKKRPAPKKSTKKPTARKPEKNQAKIELKIPIPTMTFVEVLKKQKLYDQALQLLNVLEKRTTDPEKIKKAREEILLLKSEEEAG